MSTSNGDGNGDGNGGIGWTGFVMPAPPEDGQPAVIELEVAGAPYADDVARQMFETANPGDSVSGPMTVSDDMPPCVIMMVMVRDKAARKVKRVLTGDVRELPIRSILVELPVPRMPHVYLVTLAVEISGEPALYFAPFDAMRVMEARGRELLEESLEEEPAFAMVAPDGSYIMLPMPDGEVEELLDGIKNQIRRYEEQPWSREEMLDAVEGFMQLVDVLGVDDVPTLAELLDRMRAGMPS